MDGHGIDPEMLLHFRQSWARDLFSGQYVAHDMGSRSIKGDLEDSLFGKTLKSDSTIRYIVNLWKMPVEDMGETLVLASLGDGLNGHAKIVHGGFTAMLVDEACGLTNMLYNNKHTFTASLTVNYKKPIPAPGVVLCRAQITKVVGRKRFIRCTVEGPNDVIYADCNALFLEFKEGFKL